MEIAQLIVLVLILLIALNLTPRFSSADLRKIEGELEVSRNTLDKINGNLYALREPLQEIKNDLAEIKDSAANVEELVQDGLVAAGLLDAEKEKAAAQELAVKLIALTETFDYFPEEIVKLQTAFSDKAHDELVAKYKRRANKAPCAINQEAKT